MSIHQLYIRILILSLVLGPLAWLVFTEDGQRIGDIFMLELGGAEPVNINFRHLNPRLDEAGLKKQFPALSFDCADRASAFGQRLCTAPLAAMNGAPAEYLTAFFYRNQMTALKIGYQASYHSYLHALLKRDLGKPVAGPEQNLAWKAGMGTLYTPPQTLGKGKEAAILWLATNDH